MSNAWQFGGETHLKTNFHASNAVLFFHEFVFEQKCSIQASNVWFIGCTFIKKDDSKKVAVTDPFSMNSKTIVLSKKAAYIFGGGVFFLLLLSTLRKNLASII
jgi:hypothetical protein